MKDTNLYPQALKLAQNILAKLSQNPKMVKELQLVGVHVSAQGELSKVEFVARELIRRNMVR